MLHTVHCTCSSFIWLVVFASNFWQLSLLCQILFYLSFIFQWMKFACKVKLSVNSNKPQTEKKINQTAKLQEMVRTTSHNNIMQYYCGALSVPWQFLGSLLGLFPGNAGNDKVSQQWMEQNELVQLGWSIWSWRFSPYKRNLDEAVPNYSEIHVFTSK